MIFIHVIGYLNKKPIQLLYTPCSNEEKTKISYLFRNKNMEPNTYKDIKELNLPKSKKELKRLYLLQNANNK